MRRREFIVSIGGLGWAGTALAEQSRFRLAVVTPSASVDQIGEHGSNIYFGTLFSELRRAGYVAGHTLEVLRFSGRGRTDLAEVARETAVSNPDVAFVLGNRLTQALKDEDVRFPLVALTSDPVAMGFAASLANPGGNITGFALDAGTREIAEKRFELIKELVPGISRVAYLDTLSTAQGQGLHEAAEHVGLAVNFVPLARPVNENEYRRAVAEITSAGAQGIVLSPSPEHWQHRKLVIALGQEYRLPILHSNSENVRDGGLASFSHDPVEPFRLAANTIVKIFKGARPSDIPFQQPTRFLMAVNMTAAAELGLTIPIAILARADEVIE